MQLATLQRILQFDADDLTANRGGRLSVAQREFLTRRVAASSRSGRGLVRLLVILIVVAGAAVGLLATTDSLTAIRDSVDEVDVGVMWAAGIGAASLTMLMVIVGASSRSDRDRFDDFARAVADGSVSVVEGSFRYETESSNVQRGVPEAWESNTPLDDRWVITLGSRPLTFPHGLAGDDVHRLIELGSCRGYLLTWSQGSCLVSAEPLG